MEEFWGYCKNKTEIQTHEASVQTWEQQRTPDSREH